MAPLDLSVYPLDLMCNRLYTLPWTLCEHSINQDLLFQHWFFTIDKGNTIEETLIP